MLLLLRILSLTVGAATAWRVLDGTMTSPVFKVPELVLGAALVIASLMPRGVAPTALIAASTYALGVFSVSLASHLAPGHAMEPLLIAAMAVNLTTLLLHFPRGSHH